MGRATDLKHVQIYLPSDEAREIIKKHARSKQFIVLTDYIRDLIEADLKAHGIELSLEITRGRKPKGG